MSLEPEMIGRYRVVRRLGIGGFATVYLAEDLRLDAEVAVKLLHPQVAADESLRLRFINEAQIMRRLATPGLVTVHDIGEHENRPFFVMEFCSGGTLADRLEAIGGRIEGNEALALAGALRRATAGIHMAGTVHRDLKPTNYLIRRVPTEARPPVGRILGPAEELVVGDFGLAKDVEVDATKLTISGGTPGYGAPEQFRGEPTVDARADVFSLSAILLSSLSGEQPQVVLAPGVNPFSDSALRSAGSLAPELARGMSLDRTQRHRHVMEWEDALQRVAQSPAPVVQPRAGPSAPTAVGGPSVDDERYVSPPVGTGPGAPARPVNSLVPPHEAATVSAGHVRSRRNLWVLAVLGVLLFAVIGVVAFVTLPNNDTSLIVGPTNGAAGDEVAFAVTGADAATAVWTVNDGDRIEGAFAMFTPEEVGRYRVEVEVGDSTDDLIYEVDEPASVIRIEGPGLIATSQTTTLRVVGAEGRPVTWTIGGVTSSGDTAELEPLGTGVVVIEAQVDGETRLQRSLTAVEISG